MKLFQKSLQFYSVLLVIYALLTFVLLVRVDSFTNFLISFVILTVIALLISILFTRTIVVPLEQISHFLENLANGKRIKIQPVRRKDLKNTFNDLEKVSDKLQYYEDKLHRHKRGFYTVIDSIQEAIWIQNEKGIVRTANESFEKLIGQKKLRGLYFWNIIRNKDLYDFVDSVFKNPENKSKDIAFEGKFFLCSTSVLEQTGEIVFILHDITEMKNLELMKKDLVLNVSHELRTPLTSIKGYLETLEPGITPDNKTYLETIKRNTDRLINIVNDLLTLSKLEHIDILEYEKIELKPFFENLKKLFNQRLKKKNLHLEIDIADDMIKIRADRYNLEQVFINLIDNAIIHTEEGGIIIKALKNKTDMRFEITDTGRGISAEHQSRIFERFYVVDKSRSRKTGSTGLGLSIVKHIINLHHGNIELESNPGLGSKFTITLPLNN